MAGRMFTFFGHKGGVGKSIGAVHLAVRLMEQGRNVIVADLDARQNDSRDFFVLRKQGAMTEAPVNLEQLKTLAARCRANDVDLVVDCPAADEELGRWASSEADALVIPFKPGANDLKAIGRAIKLSMRPARKDAVIFCWLNFANQTKDSDKLHDLLAGTGAFTFAGRVAQRQHFNDALKRGVTAWELTGDRKAADEMGEFCESIIAGTRVP